MNPWTPLPLGLATDLRATRLPLAARGALLDLYLAAHASADRAVVAVGAGDPVSIARQLWGAAGPAALAALLAAGLVATEPGAWRLALVAGPGSEVSTPFIADASPTDDPRRSARYRDARYRFARRERRWADVPAGVTWEAWLASPEGQAWERGDATRDGGATPCDASRDGAATMAATPCDGDASQPCDASPSHSPSSQKTEKEGKETHNTPSPERATRDGGATPCDASRDGAATPPPPLSPAPAPVVSCPTVEATGVDAERALLALRTRAPKALSWSHDSATLAAWQRAVRDLDGHIPTLTLASYELAGDWLAAGGLGWWSQGRPSLAYLLRPGVLARLLDDAAEWGRAARPKITHGRGPNADAQGAARPRQDAARGIAPVAPPGSYALPQGARDPLEAYLAQPLRPAETAAR